MRNALWQLRTTVSTRALMTLGLLACGAPKSAPEPIASTMPAVQGDTLERRGVRYIEIETGTGAPVQRNQCVYAHYTGWLAANGKQFDTSRDTLKNGYPKPPIGFALGIRQVIAGWDYGFDGMTVGGKRRLIIPWSLGYGSPGAPPDIPGRADLIFDVEVVGVAPAQLSRPGSTSALRCPEARGGD